MIEKDVTLLLRTEQTFPDGTEDIFTMTAPGTMTMDSSTVILTYNEPEETGMEGVTSTLTLWEGHGVLTRTGSVRSEMRFTPGTPHRTLYRTLAGDFDMEITTEKLAHRISSRGGIVDIRYTIAVGGQLTGSNHFKIRVQEMETP